MKYDCVEKYCDSGHYLTVKTRIIRPGIVYISKPDDEEYALTALKPKKPTNEFEPFLEADGD